MNGPGNWLAALLVASTGTIACGTDVAVDPGPSIASVDLTPASPTLRSLGDTLTLTAVARDVNGGAIAHTAFQWTSSAPEVATVTQQGTVAAIGNGSADIEARAGGRSAQVTVVVQQVAVALGVTAPPFGIAGIPLPPVAVDLVDARGHPVPFGADIITAAGITGSVSGGTVDTMQMGHAEFDSLVVDQVGTGMALRFSAGTGTEATTSAFPVTTLAFASLSAGSSHTCALDSDARGWCWGMNFRGQLGTRAGLEGGVPQLVADGRPLRTLAAGDTETCATDPGGGLWCWGDSEPPVEEPWVPRRIDAARPWDRTFPGFQHHCGLSAGTAWCWGSNRFGQLGNGSTVDADAPVPVSGGPYTTMLVQFTTTCAIDQAGALFCWGTNTGYVADTIDTQPMYDTPQPAHDSLAFTAIAGRGDQTCGITTANQLVCWGYASLPADTINAPPLRAIAVGGNHVCGLSMTGVALCWGNNQNGQLGDGTNDIERHTAAPVAGPLTFVDLSAGDQHTCGMATDGIMYCWGVFYSPTGQVNNVPTAVLGQQ